MKRFTAAVLAAAVGAAHAEETTGAAFLKIASSVQGEALGGLNPAVPQGAAAAGVNPANLPALAGTRELSTGFATMIGDSQYGHLSYAFRRGAGAVGVSATFLRSGDLEGRDASGAVTQGFRAQDMAAGITAAWGGERFRAGVTAKAVRQELGDFKSNTAPAADVGVSFGTGRVTWGAAALNLGGGISFDGRKEALPTVYGLGASVPLGGGLTGVAGVNHLAAAGDTTASLGVEYQLRPVSLRLGYRSEGGDNLALKAQSSSGQALAGLTAGLGFAFKGWKMDYAVSQTAVEYGMSHRVGLTFAWGEEPQAAAERPQPRPARAARPAAKPARSAAEAPAAPRSPEATYKPLEKKVYKDEAPAIKRKKKVWVK